VLNYAEIQRYESILTALEDALEQSNCGALSWTKPLSRRFTEDASDIIFTAYVHLKGWQWKGSPKDRIHTLIEVKERIDRSKKFIRKSTVHVDHYAIRDESAALLHTIHFDFDGERDCHPLFHAQLCKDRIVLDDVTAQEVEFEFDVKEAEVSCFRDTRIPTPDMTFPSVILCLAADRFQKSFFSDFRNKTVDLQKSMPRPLFSSLSDSVKKEADHFCSSHWFAHMK
jgi:hypothetical protein